MLLASRFVLRWKCHRWRWSNSLFSCFRHWMNFSLTSKLFHGKKISRFFLFLTINFCFDVITDLAEQILLSRFSLSSSSFVHLISSILIYILLSLLIRSFSSRSTHSIFVQTKKAWIRSYSIIPDLFLMNTGSSPDLINFFSVLTSSVKADTFLWCCY